MSTLDAGKIPSNERAFRALEEQRKKLGIGRDQWLRAAGIGARMFWRWRNRTKAPSARSLVRLTAALTMLEGIASPRARPPRVLAAIVFAAERMIELEIGNERRLIEALRAGARSPPGVVPAARLRRLGIYLAAVELEVSNAELARALHTSRQNIKQARDAVEALRDRRPIEQLLERCRRRLTRQ